MGRACALVSAMVNMVGSSSYQQESLRKTIVAVVQATRKPLHYFQKHTIIVVTQLSLRSTLQSVDYARRIVKRNVVLGAFDIRCVPRALDKGLILAGLVVWSAEFPSEKKAEGQTRIF